MSGLFGGIVLVINALKSRRIEDGLAQVQRTTAVIEGHVNSAATAARMQNEASAKEREMLLTTIQELKATAIALASATAASATAKSATAKPEKDAAI
jgi:hypothetical protein